MADEYPPPRFWRHLVDAKLLDARHADAARARFHAEGGAPDTAVLELRPLDATARRTLLMVLADACARPIAPARFLDAPEAAALEVLPRVEIERYGVLPVRRSSDRLVIAAPALPPATWAKLAAVAGVKLELHVALELELGLALARHYELPLPARLARLLGHGGGDSVAPGTGSRFTPEQITAMVARHAAATNMGQRGGAVGPASTSGPSPTQPAMPAQVPMGATASVAPAPAALQTRGFSNEPPESMSPPRPNSPDLDDEAPTPPDPRPTQHHPYGVTDTTLDLELGERLRKVADAAARNDSVETTPRAPPPTSAETAPDETVGPGHFDADFSADDGYWTSSPRVAEVASEPPSSIMSTQAYGERAISTTLHGFPTPVVEADMADKRGTLGKTVARPPTEMRDSCSAQFDDDRAQTPVDPTPLDLEPVDTSPSNERTGPIPTDDDDALATRPFMRVLERRVPVDSAPTVAARTVAAVDLVAIAQTVTALSSRDAGVRTTAIEKLLDIGAPALPVLEESFPGDLRVDHYSTAPGDVPVEQYSGVLEALLRFGEQAAPVAARLADHISPEIRYFAVYLFSVLDPAEAWTPLARALFDKDSTVRQVACAVLLPHRDRSEFKTVAEALEDALDGASVGARRHAVDGVAALRLPAMVPALADALADRAVAEPAHRALVQITRHDFGYETWQWKVWFEHHGDDARVAWLIDALTSDRRPLRAGAFAELRAIVGQTFGYGVDDAPARRRAAAQRWLRWWQDEGRDRFARR